MNSLVPVSTSGDAASDYRQDTLHAPSSASAPPVANEPTVVALLIVEPRLVPPSLRAARLPAGDLAQRLAEARARAEGLPRGRPAVSSRAERRCVRQRDIVGFRIARNCSSGRAGAAAGTNGNRTPENGGLVAGQSRRHRPAREV